MGQTPVAVSGNPAATDFGIVGTGWLGRTLGLKDEWGIRLGGLWLADTNIIVAGGAQPGGWTNNQALIVGLGVDAEKLVGWRGATFGFQFLQFNGSDTNDQAGSVAGYNGIVGVPPFNRTELLEAWYLQEMMKDVLKMRIGREPADLRLRQRSAPRRPCRPGPEHPGRERPAVVADLPQRRR